MPSSEISPIQTEKTGFLLGLINLCLAPVYYLDTKLGLTASLAITAGVLYKCHQVGEARRPGANLEHKLKTTLFSAGSNSCDNSVKNIVDGGAHIVDEVSTFLTK
ncbi:MAG: hypothetical protein PSV35_00310 [bacterium]|nr:hypothetical protein [bacterium]